MELDAGPVVARRHLPIDENTYIADVYAMLNDAFPALFVEAVNGIAAGRLVEHPQPTDPKLSLRAFPRLPQDGELQWERPAAELARLVRASAEPFAGAHTYMHDERLTVWRARAEPIPYAWLGVPGQVIDVRRRTGEVAVLSGSGALVLEEVEIGSHGRTPPSEMITSTRVRLGLNVGATIARLAGRIAELEAQIRGTDSELDRGGT